MFRSNEWYIQVSGPEKRHNIAIPTLMPHVMIGKCGRLGDITPPENRQIKKLQYLQQKWQNMKQENMCEGYNNY